MAQITAAQLVRMNVHAERATALAPHLNAEATRCGITKSNRRVRHFIAQLCHESGGMNDADLTEGLFYSTPERLCQVWPSRFPSRAAALPYAKNPAKLAEKVYGMRADLGNTAPGDGAKYIGRGLIQLTGKANYLRAKGWTGVDLITHPEYAATPKYSAVIAADFWRVHGLNEVADADNGEKLYSDVRTAVKLNEEDDLVQLTRKINGALKGLDDRRNWLLKAAFVWPD